MTEKEFIDKFVAHLATKKKKDGTSYGSYYVKDNVARLKKLLSFKPTLDLQKLDDNTLTPTLVRVANKYPAKAKAYNRYFPYAAYHVVIRIVYEMNTGKKAELYAMYNTKKRSKT